MEYVDKFEYIGDKELEIWHEEIDSLEAIISPQATTSRIFNHSTYKILLQIKATGQYIQHTKNLFEDVLSQDTIKNASFFMEEFITESSRRAGVSYIIRFYFEESRHRMYLMYVPRDKNESIVTFKWFPSSFSSNELDGRCFIKKDFGNDTIFGSAFQRDMVMTYDKRRQKLVMRRIPNISRLGNLLKDQCLFSIERQTTVDEKSTTTTIMPRQRSKIHPTFNNRRKGCARGQSRQRYKKIQFSRAYRRKRLHWARQNRRFTDQQWSRLLFCSECKFNVVKTKGGQRVWRTFNERSDYRCIQGTVHCEDRNIRVRGGISRFQETPLVMLSRNISSASDVSDILQPIVIPFTQSSFQSNAILQGTNTTSHTARLNANFREDNRVEVLEPPDMSSNLSPIQELW